MDIKRSGGLITSLVPVIVAVSLLILSNCATASSIDRSLLEDALVNVQKENDDPELHYKRIHAYISEIEKELANFKVGSQDVSSPADVGVHELEFEDEVPSAISAMDNEGLSEMMPEGFSNETGAQKPSNNSPKPKGAHPVTSKPHSKPRRPQPKASKSSTQAQTNHKPKHQGQNGKPKQGSSQQGAKKGEKKTNSHASNSTPKGTKPAPPPAPAKAVPTPESEGLIRIGSFPPISASRVRPVGDIDGNGIEDLVVMSPTENSHRGAIRLYLMGSNQTVLRSRHITPGKWGFKAMDFRPGDKFGSAVLRLENVEKDKTVKIAVGAPGDSDGGEKRGAVYIMHLAPSGIVLDFNKISSKTEPSLMRQHSNGDGFGSSLRYIPDMNGDRFGELVVGHHDNLSDFTVIFLRKEGRILSTVKFAALNIGNEDVFSSQNSQSTSPDPLPQHMVRAIANEDQCFFNATHCACRAMTEEGSKCLDKVSTGPSGQSTCTIRDCAIAHKCTCDGLQLCQHSEVARNVFRQDGTVDGNTVPCRSEQVSSLKATVIEGAVIPVERDNDAEVSLGTLVYNSTHCSCVTKASMSNGPETCADFHHEIPGTAVICQTRNCTMDPKEMMCDMDGKSLCERSEVNRSVLVTNGEVDGVEGQAYCHRVTKPYEIATCVTGCP